MVTFPYAFSYSRSVVPAQIVMLLLPLERAGKIDAHDFERVLKTLTDNLCGNGSRRPPIVRMWEHEFPSMYQKCRSVLGGLLFGRIEGEL